MPENISQFIDEYGELIIEGTKDTIVMTSISTLFAYVIDRKSVV